MSSSWGINRTMAQIHALLVVTGEPHTVDDIIERLSISRGNASMNLRDLMEWGLIQRFRRPGDRKDTYVNNLDPWQMFARLIRERKRREIDPTATVIRECIHMLPEKEADSDTLDSRKRLQSMLEIFDLIDVAYGQIFRTDEAFQEAARTFRRG